MSVRYEPSPLIGIGVLRSARGVASWKGWRYRGEAERD